MTRLKRIIFCLTLCIPLVLPLTMKTVNAGDGVILYHRTDLNCDNSDINFTSLPDDVYVYRVNTGSSTNYGYLIYKFSDDSFNLGAYASPSQTSYANMSTAIYIDSTTSNRVRCQYYQSSNLYSDVPYYNGSYHDLMYYMNDSSHVAVKPDTTNIGYLNGIKYTVNKQSTLRESSDIISWNNETDSNDNIFDATWTVDLSVIPADCVASSEEDWYKKSLFDWQMNSQTILTHTIPATNGSIEVKWSEIIDNNSGIKGWLESILDAKDINYNAHSWVYRVRLNKGSKNGEWETVYPFVAGTPSEVEKAMPAITYNSSVLNTLNSLAITTTNTDNTTNVSSVDYTYNYYITNQYDNSTKTEYNINGSSDPNGNNTDNSLGGTVIKSLIDRIIDLFNKVIDFVAGVIFGTVTSAAKGFIAKTGFIGESASMLPQMFRLLTNYVFSPSECVLSWSNVDLLGTTLIQGGSINLDEVVRQSNLTELHNLCRIVLDGGLIVYTMQRVYRKGIQLLNL